MKKLFYIGMFVLSALASRASASEPADTYLSKAFWQKLDWTKASHSRLWTLDGWTKFTGEQSKDRTFSRRRTFQLGAHKFEANLAYENDDGPTPHFTSIYTDVAEDECEALLRKFTSAFGPPKSRDGTIRLPFSATIAMVMLDHEYEWIVGQTRIHASCNGSYNETDGRKDNESLLWSAKFAHRSMDPDLEPRFAIACTRTLKFNSGQQDSAGDVVLWIDTARGRALTPELYPFSDEDSFEVTADRISFRVTRKSISFIYTINRVTGSLTGDVMENGKKEASIEGACEKTDPAKPKF